MTSNHPNENMNSSMSELLIKNYHPNNEESRQSVMHSKISNCYKITEAMSSLSSSTSSSVRSDLEITKKSGIAIDENNKYDDPVYSDPLDALEKENDTRIYNSP